MKLALLMHPAHRFKRVSPRRRRTYKHIGRNNALSHTDGQSESYKCMEAESRVQGSSALDKGIQRSGTSNGQERPRLA